MINASESPQAGSETFVPTPERLAALSFLEVKKEEAHDLLMSVEGRKHLLDRILPHAEDILAQHPDFNPETLPRQLEDVSSLLAQKERFLEGAASKEKKTVFQRALQTIREFPRNHPFITSVLAIALLTAGLARLGYIKWPIGGLFGFGEGGAGTAGAGDAAAGIAETVGGEGVVGAYPEVVTQALKAAEAFAFTPNDFMIVGRQIFFNGKVYDAGLASAGLEPLEVVDLLKESGLGEALLQSGIKDAGAVRVFYDPSARYVTWAGLNHFLHQNGIDITKVMLEEEVLKLVK